MIQHPASMSSRWLLAAVLAIFFSLVILPSAALQGSKAAAGGESQSDSATQRIQEYLSRAEKALMADKLTETGELLRQAILIQWSITPLKIENLVHVQQEPTFYGDVALQHGKRYSPNEVLRLYLEPRYYSIREYDDLYSTHLTVDVKLILEDGTIAFHDPRLIDYEIEGTQPNLEIYMDITFNLGPGIPPGEHAVEIELIDQLSGEKTTTQTLFEFEH